MKYLITKYGEVFAINKTQREDFEFDLTLLNDMFQAVGVTLHYNQIEVDNDVECDSVLVEGLDNVKEFLYKQRLDKVLEKMKYYDINVSYLDIPNFDYLYHYKLSSEKGFTNNKPFRLNDIWLSLKTVESLLKDLGA